ncbi:MAG TPA: Stp1/IreP family PP2C-type Ser/Thr phosphatase [Thermoleophilaceae bacterium]
MALKIIEHVGKSDVGRQRTSNEDSLLLDPPFFVVADGMGGARAGEVASQIATEEFGNQPADELPPEQRLEAIARSANRRIYDLAAADESRRGMGTTLTAAMVVGDEVSLGHVGDSRCYRFRDGELEQLTNDHSLVAELERTGQITPEAAEHHPQRSIITRALGPEPDVEVDTYTIAGKQGDVYVLCSDGLTGMISDEELASIVRSSDTLDAAADALIRAANQSGGKDNITVVMFKLGDDESGGDDEDPPADETIAPGQMSATKVREAAAPPATEVSPPETVQAQPTRKRNVPRPRQAAPAPPRRHPARRVLGAVIGLVIVAGVAAGLYAASRQAYFVGTNNAGLVTLYRGVPYDLPLGIKLYSQQYASGVPANAIPRGRRKRVLDHELRSHSDASDLVRQLERGQLDPGPT